MKNSNDFLRLAPLKESIRLENNLYHAFINRIPEERTVPPHYHPEIEIIVPYGLKGETHVDGQKYEISNNIVYCIGPNAVHSFKLGPRGGGMCYVLQINTEACGRLVSGFSENSIAEFEEGLKGMPVECNDRAADIAEAVKHLSQIKGIVVPRSEDPRFLSAMGDIERVYRILQWIASEKRAPARRAKHDAAVRRIIDAIEDLADGPAPLHEIARRSALSKFHLCRVFKKATGVTVTNYINDLRVNRACRMLSDGEKNVTQACYECGFENLSYFIQVFRAKMGATPKQWAMAQRKTHRKILI
jgi:AraC-like DNA-binding protein